MKNSGGDIIREFRGSESVVRLIKKDKSVAIEKFRMPRKYRIKEIDEPLRKKRTKQEARILERANENKLTVPKLYSYEKYTIYMEYIDGRKKNEITNDEAEKIGSILAQIHNVNIIHGDFTLSNLIFRDDKIYVIDFGLGFFSDKIEPKSIDAFTMLRSLENSKDNDNNKNNNKEDEKEDNVNSKGIIFLKSYLDNVKESKEIGKRIIKIRERFRYGRRFKDFKDALSTLINSNNFDNSNNSSR